MIKCAFASENLLLRELVTEKMIATDSVRIIKSHPNGLELAKEVATGDYDLLILDMDMVGSDPLEAARYARDCNPDIKILLLTRNVTKTRSTGLLQFGMIECLSTSCSIKEFHDAVLRLHNPGMPASPLSYEPPVVARLTPRENEIVRLLAEGKGVEEIAVTLGISKLTVITHKRRAMRQLGCRNQLQMALLVLRHRKRHTAADAPAEIVHFSPREQEVIDLVKRGHDTRSIADLTGLRKETVVAYRYRAMQRMEVHGALEFISRLNKLSPQEI
jgi:DNA-binding NarL/FixJ family response regulator